VLKAKPDALNEDVDPDVRKSLTEQAELISTDRLLELIDQFAVAEGRMKWAPNKKLHFEVAIIKAIQSLGQATLDEVIEKLGELRDGGGKVPPVAGIGDAGPQSKSQSPKAGITDPGYSEARVEEKAGSVDHDKIWQQVLAKIPAKSFLRTLTELVLPIATDGRNFLLGHSPEDKSKIETIASASNRRQLETLLGEVSGRDWSVKFLPKEGMPSSTAAKVTKSTESFKNDPLISEAIELFNARITS
jgi:DNA polymerase III gamma/tau subunit